MQGLWRGYPSTCAHLIAAGSLPTFYRARAGFWMVLMVNKDKDARKHLQEARHRIREL